MQLNRLKMTNWGPFYANHSIDLAVTSAAPVILFHGENMRGKTSLLRSIVWCLYGELKEQNGRPLSLSRMVNLDSLDLGTTEFGVSLEFSHNGEEYILSRRGTASRDAGDQVTVTSSSVDLKPSGGSPYPAANIPHVIENILSHDISDFFFFDGEMLSRFEERLREERNTSQGFVRFQVERALGLPFMTSLRDDLEALESNARSDMERVAAKSKRNAKLTSDFRRNNSTLDTLNSDLNVLKQHLKNEDKKVASYDAQLSQVEEIKEKFYERKSLEKENDRMSTQIEDISAGLSDLAEENWWLPAGSVLLHELRIVEEQIEDREVTEKERLRLVFEIEHIDKRIGSGVCPTCGQPDPGHDAEALHDERSRLEGDLLRYPQTDIDALRARRVRLRHFSNAASVVARVHDYENDARRLRLHMERNQQSIRAISEQISDNSVDIDVLEKNLTDSRVKKNRIENAIKGVEEERLSLKGEIAKISAKIAATPEVSPLDRAYLDVLSEARETVSKSFGRFREAMRSRVSESTSDLFKQLTTEKEYSGVLISEDYQISIVDHQNRSLRMISAGANQILTMAFIGALAECSVDEAPMVMDTPFGRLDTGHRNAILSWVSSFESQVIMFVQSGEYDRELDSDLLGGRIGREFAIDRLSPTRSEVNAL